MSKPSCFNWCHIMLICFNWCNTFQTRYQTALFRSANGKVGRRSTSGACHFLGSSPVSWLSKKQNSIALPKTKAEYIAAGSFCAQVLWMTQNFKYFGLTFDHNPIRCDYTSTNHLSKNLIQHSRTKNNIKVRHYLLNNNIQKDDTSLEFVSTENQLADIFTIPLSN